MVQKDTSMPQALPGVKVGIVAESAQVNGAQIFPKKNIFLCEYRIDLFCGKRGLFFGPHGPLMNMVWRWIEPVYCFSKIKRQDVRVKKCIL
jgi:hypothetical protein